MRFHFGFYSLLSILLVSLWLSAPPVQAKTLMQCMTDCVKYEGNDAAAKSTCKSRCASTATPQINSGKQPSCMSVYKKCNRSCAKKDKECLRQCKGGLMECG